MVRGKIGYENVENPSRNEAFGPKLLVNLFTFYPVSYSLHLSHGAHRINFIFILYCINLGPKQSIVQSLEFTLGKGEKDVGSLLGDNIHFYKNIYHASIEQTLRFYAIFQALKHYERQCK